MIKWKYSYNLFLSTFRRTLEAISDCTEVASAIASIACLVALFAYAGYNLSPSEVSLIKIALRASQAIFGVTAVFDIFLYLRKEKKRIRVIKWIIYVAIILTFMSWIYPRPEHPWIPWLEDFLYSRGFIVGTLTTFSVVSLSYALSRIPGRRTNPSLIMAGSFICFIIIGSFLLTLPRCTYHGISYFDSLFVSASAVCITGLSPVDIATTFTPLGILVLSLLVQLGSLGILTFTSFFALFFTGSDSVYNQILLRDVVYSKSMNSLVPTLLYVLGFTLTIELIGAAAVYFAIPEALPMGVREKILFSGFHSMSSFCNAGFSCLPQGMGNPTLMASGQNMYIVTSVLIFAGAIGFPILVNIREWMAYHIKKLWGRLIGKRKMPKLTHIYDINTRIVFSTTMIVFALGAVSFFILEYDNTLAGMSLSDKAVQSIFNALTPRSAGFASVNPADFLNVTLLLVMAQMVIGGASQSMAGGIKVNTLGTIFFSLRSVVRGNQDTVAFNRVINRASARRASAVLALAAATFLCYTVALMLLEPDKSMKALVFESISAVFTVGSSLGITADLCDTSKVLLSSAMFLGRVGLISVMCGVMARHRDISPYLPQDSVIIN
ncbi:MAG: hypothetical protein NC102_06095 [Clostridium sp.]|nr:hypothetical protein [Clostridium sp.]